MNTDVEIVITGSPPVAILDRLRGLGYKSVYLPPDEVRFSEEIFRAHRFCAGFVLVGQGRGGSERVCRRLEGLHLDSGLPGGTRSNGTCDSSHLWSVGFMDILAGPDPWLPLQAKLDDYLEFITTKKESFSRTVDAAVESLLNSTLGQSGQYFFETIVIELAQVLEMDIAFLGELADSRNDTVRILTMVRDGELEKPFEYDLSGTPCNSIIGRETCTYPEDVAAVFSEDEMLSRMKIQSYSGVPLWDSYNKPLGILAVLSRRPISKVRLVETVLEMFAVRISTEIERQRAENALRKSEKMNRDIVASIPVGMHIYRLTEDDQLLFEGYNPAADMILKVDNSQYCGKIIQEAFPALAQTEIPEKYRHVARTGESWQIDQIVYHEGDIAGAFRVEAFQVAPRKMVAAFLSISDYIQAEHALQCRNRELTLLNWVISAAASAEQPHRILEIVCRELARTLNLPQAAAALKDSAGEFFEVVAEYIEGDHFSAIGKKIPVEGNSLLEELFHSKTPIVINDTLNDDRLGIIADLIRQRGTRSLLVAPLVIDGAVIGSIGLDSFDSRVFTNEETALVSSVATQVALALNRAKMNETRQRLETAIEQTADSVLMTEPDGTIVYVNPAFERVSGFTRKESIGHRPNILSSGRHSRDFYEQMWNTLKSGREWRGRFENLRKDGSIYIEDAVINPIVGESGEILNFVAVKRDISREVELESQYRQSQKMEGIGRLAGGVAHDFNNLLAAIMGYSELALAALPEGHPVYADLVEVRKTADRAASLTRQLLVFARRQISEYKVVSLNRIVASMAKLFHRIIGEHIEFKTFLDPEAGKIKADQAQLEQVLMNLVVNAKDAMKDGGSLSILSRNIILEHSLVDRYGKLKPGEYVSVEVRDTGSGMNDEVLTHLFEPFFTTKERSEGTGLGLATSYGIVAQHQGHISVHSRPDEGTSVTIYLPRVSTEESGSYEEKVSAHIPGGTETILIVEDEPAVLKIASRILQGKGYLVLEASGGEDALVLARNHESQIQLMITDVVMPRIGGRELAERISRTRPALKVLFMSGYLDDTVKQHGFKGDSLELLQKPFTPNDLASTVRRILDAD